MKLIIDIPKDIIESAKSNPNYYPTYHFEKIWRAIVNGTPLPKAGHREYNDIYDHYLCGNCKTVVMDYDNYCPNCGGKDGG